MASKARQLAQSASAPDGRKNLVTNGAMQVAQRAISVTGIGASDGYFTVDRFNINVGATSAGRLTMTQTADGPSGFANCIKLDCTTADTSIAAGEFLILEQRFEGQDLQRFMKGTSDAKEYAVSFYVKGNASATYVAELFDIDNSRQVSKTFSVTTSWTRVELTFPADTTGAFDDDNAQSLNLHIWLHAGSTYASGTLSQTWTSNSGNNANRAVGGSSFFSSTDNTFFITGMQLEVGSVATEFERRSFGDELRACQRYYRRMQRPDGSDTANTIGRGIAADRIGLAQTQSTTVANCVLEFPVTMRATPTLEVSAVADVDYAVGSSTPAATDFTITGEGVSNAMVRYTESGGSLTVGQAARLQFNADDKHIAFDAEL